MKTIIYALSTIVLLCCGCSTGADADQESTNNNPLAAESPGDKGGAESPGDKGGTEPGALVADASSSAPCSPTGPSTCSDSEDGTYCCALYGAVYRWNPSSTCRITVHPSAAPLPYECVHTDRTVGDGAFVDCGASQSITCYSRDGADGTTEVFYSTFIRITSDMESAGWYLHPYDLCYDLEHAPECE